MNEYEKEQQRIMEEIRNVARRMLDQDPTLFFPDATENVYSRVKVRFEKLTKRTKKP